MAVSKYDQRTIKELLRQAEAAIAGQLPGAMDDAGRAVAAHIEARTRGGRDKHGKKFVSYAESTKRRKRRKGQRIRPPTLTDTGQMLNDLTVDVQNTYWDTKKILAEVKFENDRRSERIAYFHIADEPRSKIPKRDFWGVTHGAAQRIAENLRSEVHRIVPKDRRKRIKLRLYEVR